LENPKVLAGFYFSDGTFVKGFKSSPTKADIVKVKLEKLPFL
jgi:hypothetical protein